MLLGASHYGQSWGGWETARGPSGRRGGGHLICIALQALSECTYQGRCDGRGTWNAWGEEKMLTLLVRKPKGKRLLERPGSGKNDNIKFNIKDNEQGAGAWTVLCYI